MKQAVIPSVPKSIDRDLFRFLSSVKESIEVSRGRGGDGNSVVTKDYLDSQGFALKSDATLSTTNTTVVKSQSDFELKPSSVMEEHLAPGCLTTDKYRDLSITKNKLAFKLSTLVLESTWPIGSVFLSVVVTDPATLLGFGTWAQIAEGEMLVGFKTADPDFGVVEGTGGNKTHTHAAHDNHVVTQPNNHDNHVVTQPDNHSNHVVTQPNAHSNHIFTQPNTHTSAGAHTHDSHIYSTDKYGSDVNDPVIGPTTHASDGGHTHDAHTGGAVDAHSAHTGADVDAHSAHTGADVDGHSAHTGTDVDAHSAHDTVSLLNPFFTVYIWKRTA